MAMRLPRKLLLDHSIENEIKVSVSTWIISQAITSVHPIILIEHDGSMFNQKL